LEDAAFALRELQGEIRADPQRLETVLDRLDLLNRLKRKYGASIEEVLQFKERLASGVHDLEGKRQRRDELWKAREALSAAMEEKASALSARRIKTARALEKAVERELQKLHMVKTRFRVRFEGPVSGPEGSGSIPIHEIRENGYDRVEFMISPNVGEELRPLVKIASGGELSRIMLAMKTILARSASIETVIFDEVDAGISGATAEVVGEKLHSLSAIHQILCITHLPQIASQGKTHFLVKKEVSEGRTEAVITELEQESRVQEIARLLGGREITASAVAHAREMLDQ
jgi:DNA repair protein RecN (Recombination protein N)